MFFQVPGAVMEEIVDYDCVAIKQKKKTDTIKNPRNTLGLVNDLFPENIVPLQLQSEWAVTMNRLHANNRVLIHNTSQAHAILYVIQGVWCGYWYTKNEHPDKDKYIFGFSICYKSSETSLKRFGDPCFGWVNQKYPTLSSIVPYTDVKYGRVRMRKHTALVTKENIIEWNMANVPQYQFQHDMIEWIRNLFAEKNIIIWEECSYHPRFDRMIAEADIYKFVLNSYFGSDAPAISNLGDLACFVYGNLSKIIRTPFFEREGNKVIFELKQKISTEKDLGRHAAQYHIEKYLRACSVLSMFAIVYGDENVDYCQRAWKSAGKHLHFHNHVRKDLDKVIAINYKGVFDWMRENLPAASFLNMLERSKDRTLYDSIIMMANLWRYQNNDTNPYRRINSDKKYQKPLSLNKPKRWRANELHDLVNEELFKIQNPNESLPQDLFPTPIKAGKYIFFQPIDTHQLAKWGQAVRNCVGNSTHYAQHVMKKKEFIVLALENGNPKFTIQLEVRNSMMHVKQIVGMCNSSLSKSERDEYTNSFSKALEIREQQLSQKD